jgi:protein gp37
VKTPNLEWADAVFDPWIGCTKVSSGCAMCYAETQQVGKVKWGKGAARERTSKKEWNQPIAWNQAAWMLGGRMRVFCGSLCDVFDEEVDEAWRDDLWQLIESTPNID